MSAFAIMASCLFAGDGHLALPPKQFVLEVGIYQGDPLGNRESGTLFALCESKTIAMSNRPTETCCGCPVAVPIIVGWNVGKPQGYLINELIGLKTKVIPIRFGNGKINLEIDVRTLSLDFTWLDPADLDPTPLFDEQQFRGSFMVSSGQELKLRLSAASPTDQKWAVLKVTPKN